MGLNALFVREEKKKKEILFSETGFLTLWLAMRNFEGKKRMEVIFVFRKKKMSQSPA